MYDPATRNIKLGEAEGRRFKALGDIGEEIAHNLLQDHGFSFIVNLNTVQQNFLFADFEAMQDGVSYLISVKARNKYENTGKLNSRYKLGSKGYAHIAQLVEISKYRNHIPAWLAIAMAAETYDAYFGTIAELNGSRGIGMGVRPKKRWMKLAEERSHAYNPETFVNTYEQKLP